MASGKTLQSTIELSGVLSPSLQATFNKAVDELTALSKETLESADAASRLVAEMDAQEDILKTMQKAYAGYVASGEEGSEQAAELADKIRIVSEEIEQNRGTLQAAEDATKRLTNAQEDAEESADSSSEGYTILKNVIANLATEALQKAAEGFKELALEGDTALAMLEARTGTTGKELEGFEDVMHEVYNSNYGESLGDVGDTIATVNQMMGDLDDASLSKVTKRAIALEDVFGFGTAESLRAANSLMDKFGITSEQAFNLIVQGAQNGLNQNDDLLDTINEYSAQFSTAGYSADDMFNMLANGAENGTWSVDKLGDAVKEFNIRASDGTISDAIAENAKAFGLTKKEAEALGSEIESGSVEAYDKLLDKLKEVDDDAQRYQLGVEMFGTMWEDLGEETVLSLMDTQGEIDKTAAAMEKMDAAAYDTLEGSLRQLGRTIKSEVLQPIVDKLTPALKTATDFVTSKVGPAVDWVLDHLPEIGIVLGTIGSLIAAMKWASITTAVKKVGTSIAAFGKAFAAIPGPALAVIGIIAALAAGFAYLWKNNEEFREKVMGIWEQLKGSFSELGEQLGSTLSQLAPMLAELGGSLMTAFGQIAEAVLPVLVDLLGALLPILMQIISSILPVIVNLLSTLLPVVTQIISSVLPVAVQLLNTLLPIVMQIISAVLPILIEILNILTPILDLVVSLLQPILDLIVGLIGPILNLVMSAITPLIEILGTLIEWALKPLMPLLSAVGEIVTSSLGASFQSIQPIIQAVQRILGGLIDFISGVFSGNWSQAWSGIVETFGGLWDGLVALVKAPINGVIGLINGAIGALNKISVKIPDWVPKYGGQTFGINIPEIPQLASGGFTEGVSIAGEAGMEAVISFDRAYRDKNIGIWEKAGQLLGVLGNNEPEGAGLTSKAGELLSLDDFSLGSLADGTSVVIYYDFSNFTWSPQIQTNGDGDDEDDLMARLRAHEAEFFDWLEEFIKMREEAQYA